MKIERIVELLEIEKECISRNVKIDCNRNCIKCDLVQDTEELLEMYDSLFFFLEELKRRRELSERNRPISERLVDIRIEKDTLIKEVWELYEKYHPYLATHVYQFGEELKELLDKYREEE